MEPKINILLFINYIDSERNKIKVIKNILSNLSIIPPWLESKDEKSFKCNFLLIYEKYKSPKNKDKLRVNDNKNE